jgi:hypothetical protein
MEQGTRGDARMAHKISEKVPEILPDKVSKVTVIGTIEAVTVPSQPPAYCPCSWGKPFLFKRCFAGEKIGEGKVLADIMARKEITFDIHISREIARKAGISPPVFHKMVAIPGI